jgi:hypothetical protein
VGGRVDSLSKREKAKARKMLKNARPTHRQLHALLGAGLLAITERFLYYSVVKAVLNA